MAVVVSQDSFSIRFVKRERIADTMRNFRSSYNPSCFDLDPASQFLIDDIAVKIKQGFKSLIRLHALIVSSDDIHCIRWVDSHAFQQIAGNSLHGLLQPFHIINDIARRYVIAHFVIHQTL